MDPNLAGQWVAPVPGTSWTVTLRIETSGRCSIDEDSGFCQVRGGVLTFRESDGETVRCSCRLQNGQLILSGDDMTEPMVFRRAGRPGGGASGAAPAPRPGAVPAAAPQRSRPPGYPHEDWGLGFDVPPAWKVAKREDALLLVSDSEPGMIVIRLVRGTSESALLEDYGEGLTEEGLRLMPSSRSQPFSSGGYKGLAGELAGVAADNFNLPPLPARSITGAIVGTIVGPGHFARTPVFKINWLYGLPRTPFSHPLLGGHGRCHRAVHPCQNRLGRRAGGGLRFRRLFRRAATAVVVAPSIHARTGSGAAQAAGCVSGACSGERRAQ